MRPGDVVSCWGDGASYAVVLATSRHKATFDEATARDELAATLAAEGWELTETSVVVWRSHTKRYLELYGCECQAEPLSVESRGACCYEGDGKAWVRVLTGEMTEMAEGADPEPCPMGCGRTTEDVAGGPCSHCWDKAT